jgi:hypothetical protein
MIIKNTVLVRQRCGLEGVWFIGAMVRGSFDYGYFVSTVVCGVNGVLPVTRKMSPRCTFCRL